MTDGSGQAPAGWYNDPHSPDRMRYFDGEVWTDHFHQPGKLPDIGSWLSSTFTVFANHWMGAALLALIVHMAGGLVTWGGIRWAIRDVAIVNESFVNFGASQGVVLGLVGLVGILIQGFGWLAMSRYLHRAHFQAQPTLGDAFAHAIQRLPRYLGIMLMLVIAGMLAMFVLFGIAIAVPPIGILLILAAIPAGVWVAVKLAFVVNVIAIAPPEVAPIRASADVSAGRFWAVLGRLALFTIGIAIVGQVLSAILGGFGQIIDPDVLAENIQTRNDTLIIRDFKLTELLPSSGQFLIVLIVGSVIQGASALVSTSAFVRLYLDSGGPSEPL